MNFIMLHKYIHSGLMAIEIP